MKFAIITHVSHKEVGEKLLAYEPYVREMNLWLKYVDQVRVVAPFTKETPISIDCEYNHSNIVLKAIPYFDITSFTNVLKAIFLISIISFKILKTIIWADHIHIRCPGNVGLLGCFIQILFPSKPKTIKYAGNWDPKSEQPWSYKLQKWILSNTFLTRNAKVLVYGEWKNQSKNIVPFFTASYSEKELEQNEQIALSVHSLSTDRQARNDDKINFIFVGGLTKGKQPLLSIKVVEQLKKDGFNVVLDFFGDGVEKEKLLEYIKKNGLSDIVKLHGNADKEVVKTAFQKSHFLLFISKSEGWPKVVAEAMFWGCLPISSNVSCIPYMLDYGKRGSVVSDTVNEIVNTVEEYLTDELNYQQQVKSAKEWSQQFTLEKFELEIKNIL